MPRSRCASAVDDERGRTDIEESADVTAIHDRLMCPQSGLRTAVADRNANANAVGRYYANFLRSRGLTSRE
jgi:hypothetical protein